MKFPGRLQPSATASIGRFAERFRNHPLRWSIAISVGLHLALLGTVFFGDLLPAPTYRAPQSAMIEFAPVPAASTSQGARPSGAATPDNPSRKSDLRLKNWKSVPKQSGPSLRDRILGRLQEIRGEASPSAASSPKLAAPVGAIQTGVPFPFAGYLGDMQSRIASCWRQPPWSGGEGRVTVSFRIARDGSVAAVGVATPSGLDTLDRSATDAVRDAGQLPPLPADFKGKHLDVLLSFVLQP